MEADIEQLTAQTNEVDFFKQSVEQSNAVLDQLNEHQQQLDQLMERWLEIEDML